MSSASHALAPSRNGGQAGNRNAVKSTEKFLEPYTWATVDTVDQELTDEELVEVIKKLMSYRFDLESDAANIEPASPAP